jgi:SnoaL-like polyketide cyclase
MATTETTSRTAHLLDLMRQGDEAFNSRDVAAMAAVHHREMVAYITGNAEPIHGRDAHAAAMDAMVRAFPDVHVDNDPYPIQIGQGGWTTVITRATGTFTGEMTLPDGNVIPPTGKAFDLDFATTARWDEDTMIEEHVFWDSALQAQQIGLA